MDDVDIGGREFIFWMAMVWVVYLIAILVMLAVAYGFVRVVLTTWERVSPSAPKGSSRPHAPVKSHAPVKRRDDFYGHHRGDRPASRAD